MPGDFVAKLKVELAAGRVTEAVVLVNSNCTDTKWFQPLWDGVLCFTDHRINFYGGGQREAGQRTEAYSPTSAHAPWTSPTYSGGLALS
jgi:hypothetical protein